MKVGINGFGRIGRTVLRIYLQRVVKGDTSLEIVAVNNPLKTGQSISDFVHLLMFDSVHGRLNMDVKVEADGFTVNGKKVKFFTEKEPDKIDWTSVGVDVVIDSTGIFKDKNTLGKHMRGSVKKVVMTAPGDSLDGTFVMGVNDSSYDKAIHHIVSNASCTTNCLAPVAKAIDDAFGIESGVVSTVHAFTADQRLVDSEHDDLRRARSAHLNMIPTKTGAAAAVGLVLPHLKGKLDGFAIRVPVADVSVVDASFVVKKEVTAAEVNDVLKKASNGEMKGVLAFSELELVSSDFIGDPHSSIVDAKYTKVMNKTLVKVLSWYDNEAGYSNRVLDLVKILL